MSLTPGILSVIWGATVGWLIGKTVASAPTRNHRLLFLTTVAVIWVVLLEVGPAIDSAFVFPLSEHFSHSYFAIGALLGGVLTASGTGHMVTHR